MSIWEKYDKKELIGTGTYGKIFKAKNLETGNYVAIKEIQKKKSDNKYLNEIEKTPKIKNENIISIKETFETNYFFYIVMELCICNLEEYIKMRDTGLSIDEIKQVLIQINNTLKLTLKENLIHRDLKPSNILISLNKIDNCVIKLSNYVSSKEIFNIMSNSRISLTISPEILNNCDNLSKSDLWSLGIIIYYMYFKEYPYFGENDNLLLNDINSKKKLKIINNEELNDLLNRMLKININERISWDDYLNHSFFKKNDNQKLPFFNFDCNKHSKCVNYYCKNCKVNICINCLNEHNNHQIVSFSKIGLNNEEINTINSLLNEIEKNTNAFNKVKKDIELFFNKMKLIKENISIYENDYQNNYKQYYINYLRYIEQIIKIKEMKKIELEEKKENNNYFISEYKIKKEEINKSIKILNSFEEGGKKNKKEIKNNYEIYINNKKIDFSYEYKFPKEGKYIIKIIFKNLLINTNNMLSNCSSLTSINLSNFKGEKVKDMSNMFYNCSSLASINLSNFNTENVTDMNSMFYNCSSVISLNLSNFNTNNVINMAYMFRYCSSLTSINLSNFNTNKVNNMSYMFFECSSLTSLNLSNFNTENVNDMSFMFSDCSSLTSLNLSNFNTNKVTDMNSMFYNCSSLTSLNLSNFNTENVHNMSSMFNSCSSLPSLNLSNFKTENVLNMQYMFNSCSSLTILNLSNFNTNKVNDMNCFFFNLNKNCKIITNDKQIIKKLK